MKYRCLAMALPASVCVFALAAVAAVPNDLGVADYTNSFELYANGAFVVGQDGWYAETNTIAVVTNIGDYFFASARPLSDDFDHEKVLQIDTEGMTLSNLFTNTAGLTNVYIDMMIQLWQSEDGPPAQLMSDDQVQAALYLNESSNLVVFHSFPYGAVYSNEFSVITNITVQPEEWVRLTVTMDYLTDSLDLGGGVIINLDKYFKVAINQTDVVHEKGFASPSTADTNPGSWFVCANRPTATEYHLSSVNWAGRATLDDLIVSKAAPGRFFMVTSAAGPAKGGYITPSGSFSLPEGVVTNFNIVWSNWWNAAVVLNGNPLGETNLVEVVMNDDVEIVATFTAQRAAMNVPKWWLYDQDSNWSNDFDAAALDDTDGDGMLNWEEWLASSDPLDSNSVFQVVHVVRDGPTNWLWWVATKIDPELPGYDLLYAPSMTGTFLRVAEDLQRVDGTNVWWHESAVPNAFYRLSATNGVPAP